MGNNPNNSVSLNGRLVREVTLYKTPEGKSYCYATLAVNKKKKANSKAEVIFVSVLLSGRWAENFVSYVRKGYLVSVKGELDIYPDTKNNQTTYKTRVNADCFDILSRPAATQSQSAPVQEKDLGREAEQTSFFQGQSTQLQEDYQEEPDFDFPGDGM